jgi:uncharacterized membrane protein YdfJ with MMPL/SSD domain
VSAFFSRVAGLAVSRRGAVVAATVFITLIGTIAALRLETDADADTLFDRGSDTYAATQRLHQLFGDKFELPKVERLLQSKAAQEAFTTAKDPEQVIQGWQPQLAEFKATREKYLLYR